MRRAFVPVLLASFLLLPLPAQSQQEPPAGCFCLAEAEPADPIAGPQIQYGCERKKRANQFHWRAFCRYPNPDGTIVTAPATKVTDAWMIIPAGQPDCEPCEPKSRATDTVVRKKQDEEATK